MRAIWKGAISFGLVSIPVKLYTATEERDVAFHQVHRSDGGRVRYKRVCSVDGDEVSYGDIAKGYELPGGEMVVLTDDDLADLPLSSSREVDVLAFVPLEQVDPIYFSKSYYLEPDGPAAKPYVLLRDSLEKSGRVALVKVAIRSREALATLRVRDGVIVLETMIWPDEVREPDFGFLDDDVSLRPQELAMAESLIESMAGDFEPGEYHDGYREAVEAVVQAKVAGDEVIAPPDRDSDSGGEVLDLMAALRNSVADAKRRRGDGGATDTTPESAADEEPARSRDAATKQRAAPEKRAAKKSVTRDASARTAADASAARPAKRTAKKAAKSVPKQGAKTASRRTTTRRATPSKRARKSA